MMKRKSVLFVLTGLVVAAMRIVDVQGFDIGVYYNHFPDNSDDFEYSMMDIARHGGNVAIVGGFPDGANFTAVMKYWQIKAVKSYGVLPPGTNPTIDINAMTQSIINERDFFDAMTWNNEYVGDNIVGKMVEDEVESAPGLTAAQQQWLRTYCDIWTANNPTRVVSINHTVITPWYDLHEQKAYCSTGPAIEYNNSRITNMIAEAQSLGFSGVTAVAQAMRIIDWMNIDGNICGNLKYYNLLPTGYNCSSPNELLQTQIDWLVSRPAYQDIYDELMTAYLYGAEGIMTFIYNDYNTYTTWALVDSNANDYEYKWQGFGDAAQAIRADQGWPSVKLYRKITVRNTPPLRDKRNYPSGQITLTAQPTQGLASIQKVVFGMSTTGGTYWNTVEDSTFPFEVSFSLSAGDTVILRAQAVDSVGQGSIWAANMIYVVNSSALECGDYESALIASDLNKDCNVDMNDFGAFAVFWLNCDDPNIVECGVWDQWHQFYCNQVGSGYPGILADLDLDCDVDWFDLTMFVNDWLSCDDPQTINCP